MKCYIRRFDKEKNEFRDVYFNKHLFENQNHWVGTKQDAKLFNTVAEARATIKLYKIKNVEVEKCTK